MIWILITGIAFLTATIVALSFAWPGRKKRSRPLSGASHHAVEMCLDKANAQESDSAELQSRIARISKRSDLIRQSVPPSECRAGNESELADRSPTIPNIPPPGRGYEHEIDTERHSGEVFHVTQRIAAPISNSEPPHQESSEQSHSYLDVIANECSKGDCEPEQLAPLENHESGCNFPEVLNTASLERLDDLHPAIMPEGGTFEENPDARQALSAHALGLPAVTPIKNPRKKAIHHDRRGRRRAAATTANNSQGERQHEIANIRRAGAELRLSLHPINKTVSLSLVLMRTEEFPEEVQIDWETAETATMT